MRIFALAEVVAVAVAVGLEVVVVGLEIAGLGAS
jgi:hypothetical protein